MCYMLLRLCRLLMLLLLMLMVLKMRLRFPHVRMQIGIITFICWDAILCVFQCTLQMTNVADRNATWVVKKRKTRFHRHDQINQSIQKPPFLKRIFIYRKHSIFEYFLPDGFEMGSLALSMSKARFISRIRVRSRSQAVFLYSTEKK